MTFSFAGRNAREMFRAYVAQAFRPARAPEKQA